MTTQNGWVFGAKSDFFVFTGPIILSVVAWLISREGLQYLPWILFYALASYSNVSHVYSTYYYTYTSPDKWHKFKRWLIAIPLIFLVFNLVVGYGIDGEITFLLFTHFSMWHFIKQQQAWFYIAAGKGTKRDKWTQKIDKAAIIACTTGFVLASQSRDDSRGWFITGDIIELPHVLYYPFLTLSFLALATYILWHGYLWYKKTPMNWAAHHVLLCAASIWGFTRLVDRTLDTGLLTYFLNQFHHSIPYFLLGYRHLLVEKAAGKKFWLPHLPMPLLITFILLATLTQGNIELSMRSGAGISNLFQDFMDGKTSMWAVAILNTFSLTHFTLDQFLWNREHSPEWTKALA